MGRSILLDMTKNVVFLLCLGSIILSIPYINCLGDDTFIYMRLIENFLKSGRIEYNSGEPCYAMTSVTWFYAWALGTKLVGSLNISRYLLSMLTHLLAFLGIYFLGKRMISSRRVLFIVLTVIFFDPFYLRWLWGGWEVSLKIAVPAFAIIALMMSGPTQPKIRSFIAGICVGISFLTRPEAMVLALLGLLYLAFRHSKSHFLHTIFFYTVGCLLVAGPWLIYSQSYFGRVLPHTIAAKIGWDSTNNYLNYLFEHGAKFLKILLIPQFPFIAMLLYLFIKCKTRALSFKQIICQKDKILDFLLIFLWGCVVLGYLITGSYIMSVKTLMFSPFLVMSIGIFMNRIANESTVNISAKVTTIVVVCLLFLSIVIQSQLFFRYSLFNKRFRNGADSNFISFATKIKEFTKSTDVIGLWELGVIGYYSGRDIVDFVGLASPKVVEYKKKYGKQQGLKKYIEDLGGPPEYIVYDFTKEKYDASNVGLKVFFSHYYKALFMEKVIRIGGREPKDNYYIYVLYKNVGSTKLDGNLKEGHSMTYNIPATRELRDFIPSTKGKVWILNGTRKNKRLEKTK